GAQAIARKASEGSFAACCSTIRVIRLSPCSARKTGAASKTNSWPELRGLVGTSIVALPRSLMRSHPRRELQRPASAPGARSANGMRKGGRRGGQQLAHAGAGPLLQRDYWCIIRAPRVGPAELIATLRRHFAACAPDELVVFFPRDG